MAGGGNALRYPYHRLRVARGKASLIQQLPGGWWAVIATGTEHHIETLWNQLNVHTD